MPFCRFSSSSPCCLFPSSSSSSSPVPFPSKRLHFPPPKRRPTAIRAALKVGVEDFVELAHNKVLVASVVAGAIGQLSKPLTEAMNGKGIDLKAAFRAGGMPSTHSAGVVAATTSLGLERGFSDSIFGMSAVFAALVMYDAQGVRREVGYHAKILNQILTLRDYPTPSSSEFDIQPRISSINFKETPSSIYDSTKAGSYAPTSGSYSPQTSAVASMDQDVQSLKVNDDDGQLQKEYIKYNPLNESVGHTELQVLVGALLGFIVSVVIDSTL